LKKFREEEQGQFGSCCILQSFGGGLGGIGKQCCVLGQFGGGGGGGQAGQTEQIYLQRLRGFRDKVLRQHRTGRTFIRTYYDLSQMTVPPLQKHMAAGRCTRWVVASLVRLLSALASIIGGPVLRSKLLSQVIAEKAARSGK